MITAQVCQHCAERAFTRLGTDGAYTPVCLTHADVVMASLRDHVATYDPSEAETGWARWLRETGR